MKLLLDTHIWIWLFEDPERLHRRVAATLDDTTNELWLSPISIWEVMLLDEKDRIDLDRPAESWVRDALDVEPMFDAPLTRVVAATSRSLDLPTQDPADRFLTATAAVHGLTLVTADQQLFGGSGYEVLANR